MFLSNKIYLKYEHLKHVNTGLLQDYLAIKTAYSAISTHHVSY